MTPQQNDTLCRVEGPAPMGALMRRYWLPACLSEDVAEPDGPPRKARLLGVNLVHVGFLAEAEHDDLEFTIDAIVHRRYTSEERLTIDVAVYRDQLDEIR